MNHPGTWILLLLLASAGCSRSRVIQISLRNDSDKTVSNIEVNYPDATFGKSNLKPSDVFQYRIKPTDAGPLKISYTNAAGQTRSYSLGDLHKNDEGSIAVHITQDSAVADAKIGMPN